MTYKGHIEFGKVVFDESAPLDEGSRIRVELFPVHHDTVSPSTGKAMAEELASVIGRASGLPRDLSENHDRYLRDEHSV